MSTSPQLPGSAQRTSTPATLIFRGLTLLGILGAISLSLLPEPVKRALHTRGKLHTPGHILFFAALSFVAFQGTSSQKQRGRVLVGLCVFCFALEVAEQLIFHGPMEWHDVASDGGAVAAGALLSWLLTRFGRRPHHTPA